MAVAAVLLALMMPSLRTVKETANRVKCGSNIRQIGLGLTLYSNEFDDLVPPSEFTRREGLTYGMDTLRLESPGTRFPNDLWDGLGRTYIAGYLAVPMVFYCPSHLGEHSYDRYDRAWRSNEGEIVGNYQLRGFFPSDLIPTGTPIRLSQIDLPGLALVADAMRTKTDYSHRVGSNVLRADLSVYWFRDLGGGLAEELPATVGEWNNMGAKPPWSMLDDR
jgi:hypothetical protein